MIARARPTGRTETRAPRDWIKRTKETARAKRLPPGLFDRSPEQIARGLARVVEKEHRRARDAQYREAMSMLTFYINRAGKHLSSADRARLEKAKEALRRIFHRQPP
jgi:hypothetical protein